MATVPPRDVVKDRVHTGERVTWGGVIARGRVGCWLGKIELIKIGGDSQHRNRRRKNHKNTGDQGTQGENKNEHRFHSSIPQQTTTWVPGPLLPPAAHLIGPEEHRPPGAEVGAWSPGTFRNKFVFSLKYINPELRCECDNDIFEFVKCIKCIS